MVDIPTLLSAISTAINITKTVREIKADFDLAELRANMVSVMETLSDTKVALIEAGDEIREKDSEIERLKATFARSGEVMEHYGYLYLKNSKGQYKGRPICRRCYEVDARIMQTHRTDGERGTVVCPECKTVYKAAPEGTFEE